MSFQRTTSIEEYIAGYFPKSLPDIVLPPLRRAMDSRKLFKFYDFPSVTGGPSTAWRDERQIKEWYWNFNIKKGDVLFDIGSDVGTYTIPALARGAYVVSVTPENYDELICNINVNGWLSPDMVLPMKMAFYNKSGYLEFMNQRFSEKDLLPNTYKVERMDSVFDKWDLPIHMMKIDVEGAEVPVLEGATTLIKRTTPIMLIECHEFKEGGITNDVRRCIDSLHLGYSCKVENMGNTNYLICHIPDVHRLNDANIIS